MLNVRGKQTPFHMITQKIPVSLLYSGKYVLTQLKISELHISAKIPGIELLYQLPNILSLLSLNTAECKQKHMVNINKSSCLNYIFYINYRVEVIIVIIISHKDDISTPLVINYSILQQGQTKIETKVFSLERLSILSSMSTFGSHSIHKGSS